MRMRVAAGSFQFAAEFRQRSRICAPVYAVRRQIRLCVCSDAMRVGSVMRHVNVVASVTCMLCIGCIIVCLQVQIQPPCAMRHQQLQLRLRLRMTGSELTCLLFVAMICYDCTRQLDRLHASYGYIRTYVVRLCGLSVARCTDQIDSFLFVTGVQTVGGYVARAIPDTVPDTQSVCARVAGSSEVRLRCARFAGVDMPDLFVDRQID